MRIHVAGQKAELYLNDARHPSFIVNRLKGTSTEGTIGLYVDIGTEGYFKDLKIISSLHPAGVGAGSGRSQGQSWGQFWVCAGRP